MEGRQTALAHQDDAHDERDGRGGGGGGADEEDTAQAHPQAECRESLVCLGEKRVLLPYDQHRDAAEVGDRGLRKGLLDYQPQFGTGAQRTCLPSGLHPRLVRGDARFPAAIPARHL